MRCVAAPLLACVMFACGPVPTVDPVGFAVDDAKLRHQVLQTRVDEAADALYADANLRLLLVGHADEDNSDEYNLELSRRRAAAVRGP